jgi:hypothetical protein
LTGGVDPARLHRQPDAAVPERRRSPRYRCNGSARLQEIGAATSTWATFVDISMHGCYVETADPYSVGTLLDLKLDAGGIHVNARGEVRVAYAGVGMGISFANVSDTDRNQLRQLVASISPRSTMVGPGRQSSFSNRPNAASHSEVSSLPDATTVLRALEKFFESQQLMSRDDFLRILRNTP